MVRPMREQVPPHSLGQGVWLYGSAYRGSSPSTSPWARSVVVWLGLCENKVARMKVLGHFGGAILASMTSVSLFDIRIWLRYPSRRLIIRVRDLVFWNPFRASTALSSAARFTGVRQAAGQVSCDAK